VDTVATVVAEYADLAASGALSAEAETLEAVLEADRWSRARAEELTGAAASR
jgi:hypothetical protein